MDSTRKASQTLSRFWANLPVSQKLYSVVGIMAVLIAGELLTLRFAMHTLSAVRAFVGGESLWSKSQKDAVFSLQRYSVSLDDKDYQAFLGHLRVPEGDHRARLELMKPKPDLEIVRAGFLEGKLHPDDIMPMVELLQRFHWVDYLARAISIWARGDELLAELKTAASQYHSLVLSGKAQTPEALNTLARVADLNALLTPVEEDFSAALGEGSRWLEHIVLTLLLLAVLTVESVGITLTYFTSRSISRGIAELTQAASRIGHGDFSTRLTIRSEDELGKLARSVNEMGEILSRSYQALESRVQERTLELTRLAKQNEDLYQEAKKALLARDEFLSVASHELKTPLTALQLSLQLLDQTAIRSRLNKTGEDQSAHEKISTMAQRSFRQTRRLVRMVDELLDLTRLQLGRLELHRERTNLGNLAKEAIEEVTADSSSSTPKISLQAEADIIGEWDPIRILQVTVNLLSNAVKYGEGKPVEVKALVKEGVAILEVADHGPGISLEHQKRIFDRYERATEDAKIQGLGLGLYISRQIVEAHGGKIQLESQPGSGANFRVVLPLG